ncbi:MAG: molybdate transport system substrate-binding protein [Gammaproteobacteria bacterium]|jgi:molybdate transport system substrate-binding protein
MSSCSKPASGARQGPFRADGAALLFTILLCAIGVGGLGACSGTELSEPSVRVLGAASLRDVLEDYGDAFLAKTGTRIEIVTGGSTLIANQLIAGAEADLFLSAGVEEANRLDGASLLLPGTRCVVFRNELVVIRSRADDQATAPAQSLEELFGGDERISLAHPEAVPAGRYAKLWLERNNLWAKLRPRCVYALDVRAALAAVESGSLGLGIVYRTDAATSDLVTVVHGINPKDGPEVVYTGAVLQGSEAPELSRSFLDFLVQVNPEIAKGHGFRSAKGSE